MAARLEIRFNDRVIYLQDVDEYTIDTTAEGTVTLAAIESGHRADPATPTGTVMDGVISLDNLPPESVVIAPDAHLSDVTNQDPEVLETVHTGEAYTTGGEDGTTADTGKGAKGK
ncbi:Uncharacterised protein [Mycobacteroides abscessus subsp. abscessus]|uniref:hypothetical protein n=1 Tax=Mycobacteroides abscessus TaxID=36809 RepID=UPI000925E55C|nr:hypothetical protein [Mycobacteroides abscessus]SHX74619.1 Uncharacterised protein [Mycobacteroides abscessus subsp. abscessus]SHY24016.1 Uncharacterised protein [Mycobacteroides abscessus subsp. abscessus]SIC28558.1 Uncharacterised protein [Mycobacteroides abscessus subsp. abscessus]SID06041.1 Uncharacterised protein [Mycobacteroides abscessus subsp. abscessus]SKT29378.1 Uncharacterised protein [Mycobacteroides abscessus subsp. bolletii]